MEHCVLLLLIVQAELGQHCAVEKKHTLQNVLDWANTLYQREERQGGKYHSSGTPRSFWKSVIIITIMRQIGVWLNWTHYKTAGEVRKKETPGVWQGESLFHKYFTAIKHLFLLQAYTEIEKRIPEMPTRMEESLLLLLMMVVVVQIIYFLKRSLSLRNVQSTLVNGEGFPGQHLKSCGRSWSQ